MQTINIENILAPTDFSETSVNALHTAAVIAKTHQAQLTLLHVVNANMLPYGHLDVLPITSQTFEIISDEYQQGLEDLQKSLTEIYSITVKTISATGQVTAEICRVAAENGYDIIVMGSHGASGFREFFIGTTAYDVVRHAPCPVLTVPPGREWTSFSKVIFPVRNVTQPLEKYAFLRKIIRGNRSEMIVVGVPDSDTANATNLVEENIRQLQSELKDDQVTCQFEMLEPGGNAAGNVLRKAQSHKADLIAITANLDHHIKDFFVGPYAQQIVNHARIPVLSIRPVVMPAPAQRLIPVQEYQRQQFHPSVAFPGMAMRSQGDAG